MATLTAGDRQTLFLPMREALTVVATGGGSASVTRLGDKAGEAAQGIVPVADGETKVIGPFGMPSRHEVECTGGSISVTQAPVDFPTAPEALAADRAEQFAIIGTIGDLVEIVGAGAPVDYTDGTPPATGEGVAGIGSRYTDVTNGKLYIQGGTKAQPVWKIVTSAA